MIPFENVDRWFFCLAVFVANEIQGNEIAIGWEWLRTIRTKHSLLSHAWPDVNLKVLSIAINCKSRKLVEILRRLWLQVSELSDANRLMHVMFLDAKVAWVSIHIHGNLGSSSDAFSTSQDITSRGLYFSTSQDKNLPAFIIFLLTLK